MPGARLTATRGESRPAVAGGVPRAQRARLARQDRRAPRARSPTRTASSRRAAGDSRRALAAPWRRPRRHGRRHGAECAGAARGALRGARARRHPQRAQLPARRARRSRSASRTASAKVLITDAEFAPVVKRGAGALERPAARRRHRRPRGSARRAARQRSPTRTLLAEGDPAFAWPGPRTSGTRSRSSTRRAPPAIPRASSITIAARTSTRSATRSPSG